MDGSTRIDRWRADQRTVEQHADGGRCGECGTAGGCVVLLRAVRRRTAPDPWGRRVVEVLLGGALPTGPGR